MNELFPILGGLELGLATQAILGLGGGAAASWVSEELALSYADAGQVIIASVIATALVSTVGSSRPGSLAR